MRKVATIKMFGLLAPVAIALFSAAPAALGQTSGVTLNVATFGGHSGDVEKAMWAIA